MKKLILVFVALITSITVNAQIRSGSTDSRVAEFTKMVNQYVSGQRIDEGKLAKVYLEINCSLVQAQAEALDIGLEETREESCGSRTFPTNQALSDATFKKYAEQVQRYIEYQKSHGK